MSTRFPVLGGGMADTAPSANGSSNAILTNRPGFSGGLAEVSLLDPRFGVAGDNTTDDHAAIQSAIAGVGSSSHPYGTTIRVPAFNPDGTQRAYYSSQPIHVTRSVQIIAESGGAGNGPIFRFAPGVHGFVLVGSSSFDGGSAEGSRVRGVQVAWATQYANIRNVTDAHITLDSKTLTSATANFTNADVGIGLCELPGQFDDGMLPAGTSIAAIVNSTTVTMDHAAMSTNTALQVRIGGNIGFAMGCRAIGEEVTVARLFGTVNAGGHAVLVQAASGGTAYPSNANGFKLDTCFTSGSDLDGFHIQGHDANAGLTSNCISAYATGADLRDDSDLGNTHLMFESGSAGTNGFAVGTLNSGGNSNASTLLGCYTEGAPTNFFGQYVTVVGGTNMLGAGGMGGVGQGLVILPKEPIPVPQGSVGGNYTFALADAGFVVEGNSASGITFTIPPHASVALPIGTVIEVFQYGAGQITIAAGAGVTLRSDGSKVKTAAQYATIGLRQRAQDEWVLSGDLA